MTTLAEMRAYAAAVQPTATEQQTEQADSTTVRDWAAGTIGKALASVASVPESISTFGADVRASYIYHRDHQ